MGEDNPKGGVGDRVGEGESGVGSGLVVGGWWVGERDICYPKV